MNPVVADTQQTTFTIAVPVIGALLSIVIPRILDRRKDKRKDLRDDKAVTIQERDIVGKLQDQVFENASEMIASLQVRATTAEARVETLEVMLRELRARNDTLATEVRRGNDRYEILSGEHERIKQEVANRDTIINRLNQRIGELTAAKGLGGA